MSRIRITRRAGLVAAGVTIALVAGAGGVAAGVAYLKLGMSNTSSVTTTLIGATTGPELAVRNTKPYPALRLTVPAGVPPMAVNSDDTVTNLSADLFDGQDSAAFARGKGMRTLADRKVVVAGTYADFLRIPGLGVVGIACAGGSDDADVGWKNDTSHAIDVWHDTHPDNDWRGYIQAPGQGAISFWQFDGTTGRQTGSTVHLGYGNDPGPRRMADIRAHAYRGGPGQPCGFDVIATTWSSE